MSVFFDVLLDELGSNVDSRSVSFSARAVVSRLLERTCSNLVRRSDGYLIMIRSLRIFVVIDSAWRKRSMKAGKIGSNFTKNLQGVYEAKVFLPEKTGYSIL